MTLIIAARFTTFDAADAAASRLMEAGVSEEAMHVFYVNPPGAHDNYPLGGDQAMDPGTKGAPRKALGVAALLGTLGAVVGGMIFASFTESFVAVVAGAGVGAYVGSLVGAMRGMDKRRNSPQQPVAHRPGEGRPAGVMLAVNTEGERAREIAALLVQAGGHEVERAHGRWKAGKWEDFDPLESPISQPTDNSRPV